jgi:hypothetical protein
MPDEFSFSFKNAPISFDEYKDGILRFLKDTYAEWGKCIYVLRFLSTYFFDMIQESTSPYGNVCSDFSAQKEVIKSWARQVYSAIGVDENAAEIALQKLDMDPRSN